MRFMAAMFGIGLAVWCGAQTEYDLGAGRLLIDARGTTRLHVAGEAQPWPAGATPFAQLDTPEGPLLPESVAVEDGRLVARFSDGSVCEFAVRAAQGMVLFEAERIETPEDTTRLRLMSLALPKDAEVMYTLNAGRTRTHVVTLSAAEPNARAYPQSFGHHKGDRAGCSHEFVPTGDAREGFAAARFTATADDQPGGWSVYGRPFRQPLDLSGCAAIRAWVHGDGKGQLLKIQLQDGLGGYRDDYIPITFEGWQQVTLEKPALNTLRYDRATSLLLYYNALPPGETVTCLIDHIEAVVERDGEQEAVLLEDFEIADSLFWSESAQTLNIETLARYGLSPARFGVLLSPVDAFLDTMERFEEFAGLPSPKPGGVWNKRSPWVKRSYLFITGFSEPQFDDVLALARRGGFDMILILQDSWARATGHYEINTDNFPGGLETLANTIRRFKDEGFRVGLHFLGPSIYPPDPYLTPVPDPRLFKAAFIELAEDIGPDAAFIPTVAAPEAFPAEDGGYNGDGSVLQLGEELIWYTARSMEPPFGFTGCKRGFLGTTAAAHAVGASVAHLKKSYGYFLFDMDTTLLDEAAANFARVANACDIDMIYFDGSERLQGDHWYYNARLHKAFFDKLDRKDILLQASSFSHYSWHILARSASADGHGDLKGYLDERSGWLDSFTRNAMPLDIGWYYGYDPNATPDMFEYVLGATIGYDSSMSFQVSLAAANRHPFTGEILDLIARYERLRLSGRVPEDMRARLRIDPALAGKKEPEERAALLDLRREYRLVGEEGGEVFQRVIYTPWREFADGQDVEEAWSVTVPEGPALVGVQLQMLSGPWISPGPSYNDPAAATLESFDDLAPYLRESGDRGEVTALRQGDGGATLEGVTQSFVIQEHDPREGARYAVYAAESALPTPTGWSMVGKAFDPPLDLSAHRGVGLWLRGDGNGGSFKIQLTDGTRAADFYIRNDYEGWRYHQIPRPDPDPIDYASVRRLNFYYNGLPGNTAVSCAVDDVKALPALDNPILARPRFEVGASSIHSIAALTEGQYLFLWPGEPWRRYGLPLAEPEVDVEIPVPVSLAGGEYDVRFGAWSSLMTPVRARVTILPPERHPVP